MRPLAPRTSRRCDERGIVTAEAATVLPLLVAVTLAMVWLVTLGLAEMQVTDAAREAARALARGEPRDTAVALARRAAPGSRVTVGEEAGTVVVRVDRRVSPAAGALGDLAGATVHGEAVALLEEVPP